MNVEAEVKKQLGIERGDKNSPAYECADYILQCSTWERLQAIETASWLQYGHDGKVISTQEARSYLQPFTGEDNGSYELRLNLSVYEYKFQEALQELTALVFSAGVEKVDMPFELYHSQEETKSSGLVPYWDDIDGKGTSGDMFLYQLVYDGMRDGHTFVFVDYTSLPPGLTLAEYNAIARRPYWVQIDSRDVINWKVETINSRTMLTRVTVREKTCELDGLFGEKEITQYRVYRLEADEQGTYVSWQLYHQDLDIPAAARSLPVVDEGVLRLEDIPLYPIYIGKPERWGVSKPPLVAIAELNLQHYRDRSDYNYTHHLCNVTMLEMISDTGAPPPEQLIVAPGRILPSGYRARWVSPDAQSLNITRQKIRDCEESISFLRADYLKKPLPDQTAFATSVQLSAVDSKLEISAQFLCQSLKSVLEETAEYMGVPSAGYILVNPEVRKVQSPSAEMNAFYKNLQVDGMISLMTLRNIYKDMGVFPEWYSADLEEQQLLVESTMANQQTQMFSPNPDLFKAVSEAALKDMIDKRTALMILQSAGALPPDVTVDDILLRSGEDIALQAIGTFGVAPADPNAPSGGVALDPNRILTAYTALQKMGSPVAEELKQSLNQYLVQSANEIGKRHGTPKTDKSPEDRQS